MHYIPATAALAAIAAPAKIVLAVAVAANKKGGPNGPPFLRYIASNLYKFLYCTLGKFFTIPLASSFCISSGTSPTSSQLFMASSLRLLILFI